MESLLSVQDRIKHTVGYVLLLYIYDLEVTKSN